MENPFGVVNGCFLVWLFCSWQQQLYWNYLAELHSQQEWESLVF